MTGLWINEDETAKIEICGCGQAYCGKFAWLKEPITDRKNPAPALRSRAMVGVEVMTGFRFDGEGWSGGQFYLARRGKPASASWKLLSPVGGINAAGLTTGRFFYADRMVRSVDVQ